ncbi:MAG: hypothetical protein HDT43_01665 [Ruminococcaceae bacterium]|nr:hypothetical protein [Oscillospiraceae bacterium]
MKFLKKELSEENICEKECSCPMKLFDSELMRVLAVGMLAILACSAITALAMHTVKRLTGEEDFTCD